MLSTRMNSIWLLLLLYRPGPAPASSVPPGAGGAARVFPGPASYALRSTVLLNDVTSGDKDVGYRLAAALSVEPAWRDPRPGGHRFLLKFQLSSPKLHVRSKAAPHEGFIEHASLLDAYKNSPFFAEWNNGVIRKVYINTNEEKDLINYKKGLMSVFQFQILDGDHEETDVSGKCDVSYQTLSQTTFRKIKTNCATKDSLKSKNNNVLSAVANSLRITRYEFSEDLTAIKQIYAEELHDMRIKIKQDAGNKVRVFQELTLVEDNSVGDSLKATTLRDALQEAEGKYGFILKEQTLDVTLDDDIAGKQNLNLGAIIKENRDVLKADNLGTDKSALVFMRVLDAMREANTEDILKAMKGVKNKDILQQLCDILGYAQTPAAHQAAKSFLNFDSEYDKDNIERYMWALSVGPRPHANVILDVLKMSENSKSDPHIQETLLLTASAMANKYVEATSEDPNSMVADKIKDSISKNLSKCKDADCYNKYLRALKNFKHPATIEILLDYVKKGQRSVTVAALKALKSMPRELWTDKVLKCCRNVFYQLDKRYDSSARTLAVDIILDSRPSYRDTVHLIEYLASGDTDFEVKQFLLQRIQMISDNCPRFKKNIRLAIRACDRVNNWDTLAAKGLSTALSRSVSSNAWSNTSIVSVQEISGGVLKRGHVDVLISDSERKYELLSLGVFAGGLSSLMGSDSSETEEAEAATAGLELSVQGVQLRPFRFFSGQGELMGHVWSGTASERTTAFQALVLLQDISGRVVLGTGSVARYRLSGAASLDLAGQIQLSLWNRVAHSLVDNNAGVAVEGSYSADTPFVKSEVRFSLTLEAKLELESDIDFYDGISLCVQVKQPDTVIRHNVTKVERIPSHKHTMRKSKFKSTTLPGKTYALNRKNNHMCNAVHNK